MPSKKKSVVRRAPLSLELEPLRFELLRLLPILEQDPDWYASIYFERKRSVRRVADFKKTQVSESFDEGVVLRIYDGYSLFEQATDELDRPALQRVAHELVERVRESASSRARDAKKIFYRPPSWSERRTVSLEKEILDQIPPSVDASTPVHFGIRFEKDPTMLAVEERFGFLQNVLERARALAPDFGMKAEEVTYGRATEAVRIEEAIFVDRESNLSQALYRVSLGLVLMSGSERVYESVGGLGGAEALEFSEELLKELLDDLSRLRQAERLRPGKYRVIFSPSLSGVLAHEAFGHSQEADTCARGRSKAWELYQSAESVGNEHATILNNPAIYENGGKTTAAWGSYFFDEEGWLASEQVLLDRGRLQAPMTHLLSAIRLGIPRTANGKRESWMHGVYTRQTNTYFSPGTRTLRELMERVQDGFLALHAAGGMEDPKGMGIQVGIAYLKEIKEGRLTGRVFRGPAGGDIQMTGYTPDVLRSIVDKSKIEWDTDAPDRARFPLNDVGGCGKYHKEFVNAGCGGPYLLLDGVTLG